MNNRNNRATRAIVASLSLLAIIVFAVPWVDEYLRLRGDAAELTELEGKFAELRERNEQLNRIDAKLTDKLKDLDARSIDPSKTEMVREMIVQDSTERRWTHTSIGNRKRRKTNLGDRR